MNVNRRQMLGIMGGAVAVGLGAGALGVGTQSAQAAAPAAENTWGWTPRILDPQETRIRAREGFYHKGMGCGYGAFHSIVGTMAERYGAPYNTFPFFMMEMGKSGVSNWGSLCGALLGAAAAMALFWPSKERDPMVDELFRWYETTAFPVFTPPKDTKVGFTDKIDTSVSDSILCHLSVSRWAYKTGNTPDGKVRSERCGRLTADVAGKTVEIMNAKINGTFQKTAVFSDTYKTCTDGCHGPTKEFASPTLKGKMDCTPCHTGSEHVQNKLINHP